METSRSTIINIGLGSTYMTDKTQRKSYFMTNKCTANSVSIMMGNNHLLDNKLGSLTFTDIAEKYFDLLDSIQDI